MESFYTIAIILFFAIDALGIIPTYLSLIEDIPKSKRTFIVARELIIALLLMVAFHFVGDLITPLLSLTPLGTKMAGAIVIFLVSIRLIFPSEKEEIYPWGKTFSPVVPIATPLMAGPSVLAVIMIYSQEVKHLDLLKGIFIAWLASCLIFILAKPIHKLIGDKGLEACQRLMGLILALIASEMFVEGLQLLVKKEGL